MAFGYTQVVQEGGVIEQNLAAWVATGTIFDSGIPLKGLSNGIPAGLDQEIQFNDHGVLNGDPGLTYNKSTGILSALFAAAGSDTQIQYNNGGVLGADSTFTFNNTTKLLSVNQLNLVDTTSSSLGVISIAMFPFLHVFPGIVSKNVFIGDSAGNFTLSGTGNLGIGTSSLSSLTSGGGNMALGTNTLNACTGPTNCIAIGTGAGFGAASSSPTSCIFIGDRSGESITSPASSIGIGSSSLRNNTSGSFNTSIGYASGFNISSGSFNTFIGYLSGNGITTGGQNTIIGPAAGFAAGTSNIIAIADGNQVIYYDWNYSAAGQFRFGGPNAASPGAVTIGVQSVATGTSNTAGADWTFIGSASTGNAAGGSLIFQTTPAGTPGASQNTPQTQFKLNADRTIQFLDPGVSILDYGVTSGLGNLFWVFTKTTAGTVVRFRDIQGAAHAEMDFYIDGTAGQFGTFNAFPMQIYTNNANTALTVDNSSGGAAAPIKITIGDSVGHAAPPNMTLQAEPVKAGTTNTAGVALSILGSASTGNADGGAILFQVTQAGAAGSSQNTFVNGLLISPVGFGVIRTYFPLQALTPFAGGQVFNGQANNGVGTSEIVLYSDSSYGYVGTANAFPLAFFARNGDNCATMDISGSGPFTKTFTIGNTAGNTAPASAVLNVENVKAGTSNTAGADFTIIGSTSTGNALGGSILFQTSPAGTSGTSQNTPVTMMSIDTFGVYAGSSAAATSFFAIKNTNGLIGGISTPFSWFGSGSNTDMAYVANNNLLHYANNVLRLDHGKTNSGMWTSTSPIVFPSYTVATLPAGVLGAVAYITDGDAGLTWGQTALHTVGTTKYLVWYNGANWTIVGK